MGDSRPGRFGADSVARQPVLVGHDREAPTGESVADDRAKGRFVDRFTPRLAPTTQLETQPTVCLSTTAASGVDVADGPLPGELQRLNAAASGGRQCMQRRLTSRRCKPYDWLVIAAGGDRFDLAAEPRGGIVTAVQPASAVEVPDPRPALIRRADGAWLLSGSRCSACGYPVAEPLQRCPICRSACQPSEFGPAGTVFAATVLRVPVPGRAPPYALAYVDVDDGPRILSHVDRADVALVPGARVRFTGVTTDGDPLVALFADSTRNGHDP